MMSAALAAIAAREGSLNRGYRNSELRATVRSGMAVACGSPSQAMNNRYVVASYARVDARVSGVRGGNCWPETG